MDDQDWEAAELRDAKKHPEERKTKFPGCFIMGSFPNSIS
jgi:hypothetical protein